MIPVRIKIADGEILDTYNAFGFAFYKSDNLVSLPEKERESTSYAGTEGENIHNVTVLDAFDYSVYLFAGAVNGIDDANEAIQNFHKLLYTQTGDYRVYKRVYFYNDYKKHLVVGLPTMVSTPTEYWKDAAGNKSAMVVFELKIRVDKPSECNLEL